MFYFQEDLKVFLENGVKTDLATVVRGDFQDPLFREAVKDEA
jgi:hypothetical protein